MPETFPYAPVDGVDHVTDVNAAMTNPIQRWLEYKTDVIPVFKVDPNNPKAYATVNAAYADAIAGLPANMPVIIKLASNRVHTMSSTLALVTSRSLSIIGDGSTDTELIGSFTLSDATAEAARRILQVKGTKLTLNANFTTAGNWHFVAEGVLLGDNGSYEVSWDNDTDDCYVSLIRCRMAPLSDTNGSWAWWHATSTAAAGLFEIIDSHLTIYLGSSSNWLNPRGAGKLNIINSVIDIEHDGGGAYPASFVNFRSGTWVAEFQNSELRLRTLPSAGAFSIVGLNNNATVVWNNLKVFLSTTDGRVADFGGNVGTHTGAPIIHEANDDFTNPPNGTQWFNSTLAKWATYLHDASHPCWRWSDWAEGEGLAGAGGDTTASTGLFATVDGAYDALDAVTPAGKPIIINAKINETHTLGALLTSSITRDLTIQSEAGPNCGGSVDIITTLAGNITLPAATSDRVLVIKNLRHNGTITEGSQWKVSLDGVFCNNTTITRTHGVSGATFVGQNLMCNGMGLILSDTDAIPNNGKGSIYIANSRLFSWATTMFTFVDSAGKWLPFRLTNVVLEGLDNSAILDGGGATSNVDVSFIQCTIQSDVSRSLFANIDAATILWEDVRLENKTGVAIIMGGSSGTHTSIPIISGDTVPVDPPNGTIWEDQATGRTATYRKGTTYNYWQWSDWAPGYGLVDPDKGNATATTGYFGTIKQAYDTLNDTLASGDPIHIGITDKTHVMVADITLDGLRHFTLEGVPPTMVNRNVTSSPFINGNGTNGFVYAAADAAPSRRRARFIGIRINYIKCEPNSNWETLLYGCHTSATEFARTHGTNGSRVISKDSYFSVTSKDLVEDQDTWAGSDTDARVSFEDCEIYWGPSTSALSIVDGDKCGVDFVRCYMTIWLGSIGTASMVDMATKAGYLNIDDTVMRIKAGAACTLKLIENTSGGFGFTHDCRINVPDTYTTVDFDPDAGSNWGPVTIKSQLVPLNPMTGTTWEDLTLDDILTWDGTYWTSNGIYRHDVNVNIGLAAAEHDVGWDVPSGGAIISMSVKLLKALAGAGGATAAGLGINGDPDKYAETSALTINAVDQNLHGTFNDGGGDDLKISATDGAGNPSGTLAGSDAADVRALIYFQMAKTL